MTLESRKFRLIQLITGLDNEFIISKLESLIVQLSKEDQLLFKLSQPMKERLDINELIEKQGYKPSTKEEIDALIKEADIQEPIEELLEMI